MPVYRNVSDMPEAYISLTFKTLAQKYFITSIVSVISRLALDVNCFITFRQFGWIMKLVVRHIFLFCRRSGLSFNFATEAFYASRTHGLVSPLTKTSGTQHVGGQHPVAKTKKESVFLSPRILIQTSIHGFSSLDD